jgi:hypothetical protein
MEGYCSTGQSPQWAVVPVEEEEEEEEEEEDVYTRHVPKINLHHVHTENRSRKLKVQPTTGHEGPEGE